MGHYAKVLNGVVVNVIVADKEFFDTFVDTTPGEWIQTSYNTRGGVYYTPNTDTPDPDQSKALRKNFAGIGYLYDARLDAFIEPKQYDNWILDEQTGWWMPPVPKPTEGNYYWNQEQGAWLEVPPLEKK